MSNDTVYLIASLVKAVVIFLAGVHVVPILVILERRISAWVQFRIGPNRVGPLGLLQPLADLVKFISKEDFKPANASPLLFGLGPILTALPPFLVLAMIPLAPSIEVGGRPLALSVVDTDLGLLFVLALSSLSVYGIAIGGWSSDNKYSLLGGLRSSAQMVSYELALGLSALAVVAIAGSVSLPEIVAQQSQFIGFAENGRWAGWNVFAQPLAFILFLVAGFAETNRLPFDLPEAESELVGGYHTEYGGTKFALFFMGEYVAMLAISLMISILFLGGWHFPGDKAVIDWAVGLVGAEGAAVTWVAALIGHLALLAKVGFFLFLFIQIRWTLPRFRYDQLMTLGWKVLLPLAIANLLLTGAVVSWS